MKKVYKYGTGHPIPKEAKYLCTRVESVLIKEETLNGAITKKNNILVWHYYEVEVTDEKR